MFIDVAEGTILSREELRGYASQGLVVCAGVNISHIIEYVTEDLYTEQEAEACREEGWQQGYLDGYDAAIG